MKYSLKQIKKIDKEFSGLDWYISLDKEDKALIIQQELSTSSCHHNRFSWFILETGLSFQEKEDIKLDMGNKAFNKKDLFHEMCLKFWKKNPTKPEFVFNIQEAKEIEEVL